MQTKVYSVDLIIFLIFKDDILLRSNAGENGDLLGGIPSLAGDAKPSGFNFLKISKGQVLDVGRLLYKVCHVERNALLRIDELSYRLLKK